MNLAMEMPVIGASCAVLALPGTTIQPLKCEIMDKMQ